MDERRRYSRWLRSIQICPLCSSVRDRAWSCAVPAPQRARSPGFLSRLVSTAATLFLDQEVVNLDEVARTATLVCVPGAPGQPPAGAFRAADGAGLLVSGIALSSGSDGHHFQSLASGACRVDRFSRNQGVDHVAWFSGLDLWKPCEMTSPTS